MSRNKIGATLTIKRCFYSAGYTLYIIFRSISRDSMTRIDAPRAAPAEYIQWFRQLLDSEERDFQSFIDPTTEMMIIVCKFTPTIQTRLLAQVTPPPRHRLPDGPQRPYTLPAPTQSSDSLVQSTRRSIGRGIAAPIVPGSSESGDDLDLDHTTMAQLEDSAHDRQRLAQPVATAGLVFTVSSRNKVAEKRRAARGAKKADAVVHGRVERSGRRSRRMQAREVSAAIARLEADDEADGELEEEVTDRWFKQNTIKGKVIGRTLQRRLVRMARAIAGREMVEDWQDFMKTWREHGHLTSRPTSRSRQDRPGQLCDQPDEIVDFYYTFNRSRASGTAESWRAITTRIRMVDLWDTYKRAEAASPTLPVARLGQTRQAQQKRFLFDIIYPEFGEVLDAIHDPLSKQSWKAFSDELRFAKRWYTVQRELGYGILGLIPNRVVSNWWVQKDLNDPEFELWIEVIKHFNPQCITAGENWNRTLYKAFKGHLPSRQIKAIEGVVPALLSEAAPAGESFGLANYETDISGDDMPNNLPRGQLVRQGDVPDELPSSQLIGWDERQAYDFLFQEPEPYLGYGGGVDFADIPLPVFEGFGQGDDGFPSSSLTRGFVEQEWETTAG